MSEKRMLGELLDISLQLGNGATQTALVRVFIDIKDSNKVLMEPRFEIFDNTDGLYVERTRTMPADRFIYVTYTITDAGGVNLTTLFQPSVVTEEYLRDTTGELVEDGISGSTGSQDNIEAVINDDPALQGELQDSNLIAEVTSDTILEGEIRDEC